MTGVYTSIQDLVDKGLKWSEGSGGRTLRLTLVKPDTFDKPLGSWNGGALDGLAGDLRAFVETHEFTEEEVNHLVQSVAAFV